MLNGSKTGLPQDKNASISIFLVTSAIVLAVSLLQGCQGTYDRYTYKPRPASAQVTVPDNGGENTVPVLVSVLGIRNREALGTVVEVRMRIDNDTRQTAIFNAGDLQLFAADLRSFPLVRTEPSGLQKVSPDGTATVDAMFEFPESLSLDSTDVSGLSLRWSLKVGDRRFVRTTSFERQKREAYRTDAVYHYYPASYHHRYYWW